MRNTEYLITFSWLSALSSFVMWESTSSINSADGIPENDNWPSGGTIESVMMLTCVWKTIKLTKLDHVTIERQPNKSIKNQSI